MSYNESLRAGSNYPLMTQTQWDSAPFNQPENDPIPFNAEVQQTLHKVTEVYTDQYIAEWDGEQGIDYDTCEVDWSNEFYDNDHYTPIQLIELYKKELETKLELTEDKREKKWIEHMIEECSNWEELETEIYG